MCTYEESIYYTTTIRFVYNLLGSTINRLQCGCASSRCRYLPSSTQSLDTYGRVNTVSPPFSILKISLLTRSPSSKKLQFTRETSACFSVIIVLISLFCETTQLLGQSTYPSIIFESQNAMHQSALAQAQRGRRR